MVPSTALTSAEASGYRVELRFYEELNDFLPSRLRKRSFTVDSKEARSVKDLLESQGVPHTEIDLILVDGDSVGFDTIIDRPVRIAVYPRFERLDIASVSNLGRPPLRVIRFVADVHLGKLVRRLRLLGFDCRYNREWDDAMLARISADEERILLTRDAGLLKRSIVTHGMFIHSDAPRERVRNVVQKLDLYRLARPFARCVECNGQLVEIPKEHAQDRVPEQTYRYVDRYLECDTCGKVYWKGTHWKRLERLVADALDQSTQRRTSGEQLTSSNLMNS